MSTGSVIPRAARALGWLGVLPFAAYAAAVAAAWSPPGPAALTVLLAYAAVILSFMAGVQWGVSMGVASGAHTRGYGLSVLPALLAWVCLLLAPVPALALLMLGFAALLAYDLSVVRAGHAPGWYSRLRIELTGAVLLSLGLALVALITRS